MVTKHIAPHWRVDHNTGSGESKPWLLVQNNMVSKPPSKETTILCTEAPKGEGPYYHKISELLCLQIAPNL